MIAVSISAVALAIWVYLVFARGGFWLCRERDNARAPLPAVMPQVAVVVPARNEADSIGQSITSLLNQDYPALAVVLVDDDSTEARERTSTGQRRSLLSVRAADRVLVAIDIYKADAVRVEMLAQQPESRFLDLEGSTQRTEMLVEGDQELQRAEQIGCVERGDIGAPTLPRFDNTEDLQPAQGLAQARAAHLQHLCEVALRRKLVARLQIASADQVEDLLCDLIGKRVALDRRDDGLHIRHVSRQAPACESDRG